MMSSLARGVWMVFLAAVFFACPAVAQETDKTPPTSLTPTQVQEKLAQQEKRLVELERLLKQQVAALEALHRQLGVHSNLGHSAAAAGPAPQAATPRAEIERLSSEFDALAAHNQELRAKVSRLEQESKESEESVLAKLKGLGNFSFSGDLRVRYEPFFGGTLSQNRHRERLRLRFSATSKISDELLVGMRIASGNETDSTTTNQTLTGFFTRKPLTLDRAFAQYRPKWFQPLTLTGGKFAYTWYRTELTFDEDINPEGFSQVLSFDFENHLFKNLTLAGFQLPFRETRSDDDSFLLGGQVQGHWRLGDRVRLGTYAAFYNWLRLDPAVAATQNLTAAVSGGACDATPGCTVTVPNSASLSGNGVTNATSGNQLASNFALLDLIARIDFDTGYPRWPLRLQLDFVNNTRPCTNVFVATCNPRDRSGWWAEAQFGRTRERHDAEVGYTFIRIEREAVPSIFNFSDLRQPTNVANHRFNFGYQAYRNVTLNYTLLVGRQLQTATSPTEENWLKRMQFDVIYKF